MRRKLHADPLRAFAEIGQRKRDNIAASGAKTVACGCPACMMQLSNMLALNNDDIKVKHVAEIFADTLDD